MKPRNYLLASIGATLLTLNTPAAVLYVDVNSVSPTPPYSTWATAARVIQDAVTATTDGDTILVTNGLYNTGAYEYAGLNRVLVTNAVTVRSVNGPAVTTIQGYQLPGVTNGTGAIRCAYLTNAATLSGFTLTGGATSDSSFAQDGGGVLCRDSSVIVSNCVISWNAAKWSGGGISGGTLHNCLLTRNTAGSGGGGSHFATLRNCLLTRNSAAAGGGDAYSTLYNCTLSSNTATTSGGGAFESQLFNCILYYDSAPTNPEFDAGFFGHLIYCCCAGLTSAGNGCFSYDPRFVNRAANDFRLQADSPCINSGQNFFVTNNCDLGGAPRIAGGTVDVGAYERQTPVSVLSYAWAQRHNVLRDGSADYSDPDNDGSNNWHEWQSETNPRDELSVFKLWPPVADASGITLSWNGIYGRWYYLQRSTNLNACPAFTTIITNIFGSWENTTSAKDTQATNAGPYFYRVFLEPQTAFGVLY